ncbi:MAG: serine/threonine-protein phosphatase [Lachnospiraceae bacterium]|nr:serine/threonine-protein phosphatase [Lachnospiraceae bacterium]
MLRKKTEYFCAHLWEQGGRSRNQDSLALWQLTRGGRNCLFGIVCDGIGGLKEGETASGYVARQAASWFRTRGYRIKNKQKLQTAVRQLFFQLHEELKDYGEGKGIRLGTTVTFFLINNKRLFWGHAGDSRLYFFRKRSLKQLTRDDQGADGALNRAIGAGEWRGLVTGWKRIREGDRVLLCTDGFYRGFTEEEIASCLNREPVMESQAKRMLGQMGERKLAMGEKDNISALYCGLVLRKKRRRA